MTRLKVCGIMNQMELSQAVYAGVDAVGFVVEIENSRHRLSADEAALLIKNVPVFTKSVAVIAPNDANGFTFLNLKRNVFQRPKFTVIFFRGQAS